MSTDRAEKSPKGGFTLIELLVVVGITAIVMVTVSTMFMTFILSSGRTNARRIIQSEGSSAMSQIEFEIRNATAIDNSCDGSTIYHTIDLKNAEGLPIAIDSVGSSTDRRLRIGEKEITSQTIVTDPPDFVCTQNSSGSKSVKVKFSLNITDNQNNNLTQSFISNVQIRNTAF